MNWFNNYINIAWSFLIHLANIFLQCGNFKTPKLEKRTHPPNDRFLIKIELKNAVFGSSERLPPLSGVPPTNKRTPPQLVNPSQPRWLFYMRASDCNQFSNELVQQLYQHCLIFPHPPRKYNILLQCASFKTPKLEKKRIPQMIDF